jgi:NAD(P)-dependent dehydrogenase (short-subunit alcohol dehydrogenase family)
MTNRPEGRVAIVIGGHGIGKAYATRFAAEGAEIVVAQLDEIRTGSGAGTERSRP